MSNTIQPVILCGGTGSRLWPLSRETYPKQFLQLGPSAHTMLQETALRLAGLEARVPVSQAPIAVSNAAHRFIVAQQLQEVGFAAPRVVLEPVARNTAPALALAALLAQPDDVLLVMPADHVIEDQAALHRAIEIAWADAKAGAMVTFGIQATSPETGYGYIQVGEAAANGSHALASFAEKPTLDVAQNYLDSGDYVWNSGMFMVRADVWLKALGALHAPMLAACEQALQLGQQDADFIRPHAATFEACPSDSIDYAVMEQLQANPSLGIAPRVVPLNAGWSDLGAWDALWSVREHDAHGNAIIGNAVQHGCTNSLFLSSSRLVAGVGLDHIAVVETPDAILVADMRCTQDVKKIVTHLQKHGQGLAHSHRKVHRPWGSYDSIDFGDRFQVKRIVVNPGASLSLQMHHHRAEHWVVVKGTAEVTNGDRTFLLGENESTFIPLGHIHRLRNPGKLPLEIVEVQSGSYLGEDDIVRYEDSYGRTHP